MPSQHLLIRKKSTTRQINGILLWRVRHVISLLIANATATEDNFDRDIYQDGAAAVLVKSCENHLYLTALLRSKSGCHGHSFLY